MPPSPSKKSTKCSKRRGGGDRGSKGVLNNVEKIAQSVERDIPNIVRGFVTSGILFVDVFIVFQFSIE